VAISVLRYVVDIPPELAEKMNHLVRSGRYKFPQDFIIAAMQNQAYIESQEGLAQLESTNPSVDFPSSKTADQLIQLLKPPPQTGVRTVAISNFPRPEYLWGQYNRIFPVKVIARVASNLAKRNESSYVPLGELREVSAELARTIGRDIVRAEKKTGRKRGDIISAGLPTGSNQEKAKARFKNQFVGYLSEKRMEGAAPTLRFLELSKDVGNIVSAGITDFGLKFAAYDSPVIDSQDYSIPFSSDEVDFLLEHLASQLPEEAKLMRLVLSGVKEGVSTPESLNDRMKSYNSGWSDVERSTMRAGVISRVSELGLLDRKKNGVKVTYLVTELGEKYLQRLAD
jgi:Arc/MetJ-type ribon-helix-helix transcriptional regulator